jgi:hypothetical protein
MKTRSNLISTILVAAIACATAILSGCATGKWKIDNPYADVDWKQHRQVKANFHTHTTQSDGKLSPAEAIAEYHKLGYGVLALTDHNKVTWPWSTYDPDSEQLEMISVQGAEASRHHHMGTFFCEAPGKSSEQDTLAEVREQDGVAIMFHPGRYKWSVKDYAALCREWHELIGMGIFNQGDRYPGDRKTWDSVLTVLMPEGRPVWGFSNDDMHRKPHLGRNWTVLLLPELSSDAVRTAMVHGAFFFVYAPGGHKETMPPIINSIEVDSRKGTIRIKATDHERIEWISGGTVVHNGEMIDLATTTNVTGYVRAVLYAADDGSLIGTQPMRIQPRD